MKQAVTIRFKLKEDATPEDYPCETKVIWPDGLPLPLMGDHMSVPIYNRYRSGKIVGRYWSFSTVDMVTFSLLLEEANGSEEEDAP